MKNPNQAKGKGPKKQPVKPAQKLQDHAPLPIASRLSSALAADPFGGRNVFTIPLDWIGDTMQPEISQGNIARLHKREDMRPCLNELVLGRLKSGAFVFGAFSVTEDDDLLRIGFINPKYPSVYYREVDFQWLYPVEDICIYDATGQYHRIVKNIEFEVGDEDETRVFPVKAPSRLEHTTLSGIAGPSERNEGETVEYFVAQSIEHARSLPIGSARAYLKGLLLVGQEHRALDGLREVYSDLVAIDDRARALRRLPVLGWASA